MGNGELFDDWGSMEIRWSRYAKEAFGEDREREEEGSDNGGAGRRGKVRKGKKRPEYELPTADDGTPRLPDILDMPVWRKKDVMRAFVTYHYRTYCIITADSTNKLNDREGMRTTQNICSMVKNYR